MILDKGFESEVIYSPICIFCKNYLEKRSCKAFKDIPLEIWEGKNDHTNSVNGDNGIKFELYKKG